VEIIGAVSRTVLLQLLLHIGSDGEIMELHWLDIPERIQFHIAVTVHRSQNGLAPAYLFNLVV